MGFVRKGECVRLHSLGGKKEREEGFELCVETKKNGKKGFKGKMMTPQRGNLEY